MSIEISFHGELNDLLPARKRNRLLTVEWKGRRSVKDLVESFCVPHTEVGGIQVNDRWVDFSYILDDNDRVTVFPTNPVPGSELDGPCLICTPGNPLFHPMPVNEPRFLCDVHLWKLARRLRLLGYDTWHDPRWDDAQLAELSHAQGLILLTRDRGLLIRRKVERGIYIHNTDPEQQVKELLQRIGLRGPFAPFTRCLLCNGYLEPVDFADEKAAGKYKPLVPGGVLKWSDEFHYCPNCQKMFWKGSHYEKLIKKIKDYGIHIK
ncbi:MAG TPA: Mut7-C RNAse domain-containing protein [Candidatus Deferrimicrobium sp.]|nr:Mut7-C RNAse domain-containing protein [Candidatus Deferrimicrobium sp.]